MKIKNFLFTALSTTLVCAGFTSCSEDDEPRFDDEGSKVELGDSRVFILNEGSYNGNNAGITFYNPDTKTIVGDLYFDQNGVRLGDTGQDIITYDNDIFVSVYGSKYVARLNSAGVEKARYAFTDEQGQPRYLAADDDKLYVTLSSGNVARLDAESLQFESMVKVGNNPEHIIVNDDKIYCTNSGFGYDNRLAVIDEKTFNEAEMVTIFANPDCILACGDKIIIQGYGGTYGSYTYPVAIYDPQNKTYQELGKGTKVAAHKGKLYVAYCDTDWSTYTTTTTFWTYDTKTGKREEGLLKDEKLNDQSIYMFDINPNTGELYFGTSDYRTNGQIYRYTNDGYNNGSFTSGGISPKKAVFLKH